MPLTIIIQKDYIIQLVENSMRGDGKKALGRRELAGGSGRHPGGDLVDNNGAGPAGTTHTVGY
jgi:hypothetical protein